MIISRLSALAGGIAIAASALVLAGCSGSPAPIGGNTLPPIIVEANDLQGTTVEINSKQPLYINTGDLAPESYSLVSAEPEGIVEFVAGGTSGGVTTNPGFTALKEGTADVVLKNSDGGIQDLSFTIEVVPAP